MIFIYPSSLYLPMPNAATTTTAHTRTLHSYSSIFSLPPLPPPRKQDRERGDEGVFSSCIFRVFFFGKKNIYICPFSFPYIHPATFSSSSL